MSKKIKIKDLKNPSLTEFQQAAKDYGETVKLELTAEAVINKASNDRGLKHFGSEDFLERLNILMQSISNDKGLAGIGKLGIL